MSKSVVQVIPSASRLIHSLRDIGYDFVHAVADLVDNSIAAGASEVLIDMRFDGHKSWVRVTDNGKGMSGTEITEAMRFGTEREYEADELGKYGLGLKTASLSQCSCLTVASRVDTDSRRMEVRQWNLEHVESSNRWEILNIPAEERPDVLTEPLRDHKGTVVLWESLDRILGYRVPWGERARSGFFRLAEQLDEHLGMVFHRFLSGEAKRKKKLSISINGTKVMAWDPFAREEHHTAKYQQSQFDVQTDDGPGVVAYVAYILPAQEKFSSLQAFNRFAGPAKWNYQQGFYIYRADRMIQSGGWSYMRTCDEHTKLARVALDFLPDLDSAFELNVAKARVSLPADLRNQLKPYVEEVIKRARHTYGVGNRDAGRGPGESGHPAPGPGDGDTSGGSGAGTVADPQGSRGGPRNKHIGKAIEVAAAEAGEEAALRRIRQTLKKENPEVSNDIGW